LTVSKRRAEKWVVFQNSEKTVGLMGQQQKAANLAYPSASKVKSGTIFHRYAGPSPRHGFRASFKICDRLASSHGLPEYQVRIAIQVKILCACERDQKVIDNMECGAGL
jgi:hypothetical protein